MSLEEFRSEEPNVKTFNVEFTYGNGFFSVPVVDGKFDKISFDPDLEDEAEDMEELKSLLAELGIKEPEIEI